MNLNTFHRRGRRAAYSLAEVLVAAGLIAVAIGAAVSLSFATTSQEEAGARVARGLNVAENAARLYRLGLSGAEVIRLLPYDPVVYSISITEDTPLVAGVGLMDRATVTVVTETNPSTDTLTWSAGKWTGGPGGAASRRTFTTQILRPTVRAGGL